MVVVRLAFRSFPILMTGAFGGDAARRGLRADSARAGPFGGNGSHGKPGDSVVPALRHVLKDNADRFLGIRWNRILY